MSVPAAADLSGLASLVRDPRLDLRPVLLRVQTDLFLAAQPKAAATMAAFEALACGLVPTVDEAVAARIARKLAPCPETPDAVIAALAARGGEARRAVAAAAPRLTPGLVEESLSAGGDLAAALAARADLSPGVVADLAGLADDGVDFALAMNRDVSLPAPVVDELLGRARRRPALAHALLGRGDLSASEEAALYDHADRVQRARIRGRLGSIAALRRGPAGALPAGDVADLVDLAERSRPGFEGRLAGLLGLPSTPDWRFEHPSRHELLAISLCALGVPSAAAVRIFLTLEPAIARCVPTVFDLAALARTLAPPLATTLLEAILGTGMMPRRAGRHAPAMDPSGTPGRAVGVQRDRGRIPDLVELAG